MALPDDYLADAKAATEHPTIARQSRLRRATSTAYYALFLELIDSVGGSLAPSSPPGLRSLPGRKLTHDQMRKACAQWIGAGSPWTTALGIAPPPQGLKDVAEAFVGLQQLRHEADYDLDAALSSAGVQAHIAWAENAISRWRATKTASPDHAAIFMVSLMHPSPR